MASNLITNFGGDVVIAIISESNYDAALDSYTKTKDIYSVNGVAEDFNNKEIDGTLVKAGDQKILVSDDSLPDDIEKYMNTTLTFGSYLWRVEGVKSIQPDGVTKLLYIFHVRKTRLLLGSFDGSFDDSFD
ncbi:MAG: hypothetical protein ABII90_10230 [Bacteroidota bacterium]